MSVKRQATTELNHDNWDQEDPEDHEEMGTFKTASKDVLEKRVIRTAKRRAPMAGDEPKKSVFSGFGFNKSQPASFDFLSKLTNGNDTNGAPNKAESSLTPGLFKPSSSPSGGIFGIQSSPKSPFGTTATTQSSSLFGVSSAITTTTGLVFSNTKPDSTVSDSPFKIQTVTSTSDNKDQTKTSAAPVSSHQFGIPSTGANKTLFTTSSNSSSNLFKIPPMTTTNTFGNTASSTKAETVSDEAKKEKTPVSTGHDPKKIKYYTKLKGLNESVSDWIKKHVEETPLCLLTPIFKDYENYLKEIQDEYHSPDNKETENKTPAKPSIVPEDIKGTPDTTPPPTSNNSLFGIPKDKPGTGFSFGVNTSTSNSSTTTTAGFSFGVTASSQSNVTPTSSPFSMSTNTSTNGGTFSFGAGKPFSFNSNIQQSTEKTDDANDEEDTPPKVEFTPVVEENSVYDKRCKIFVKKDGNFVDKGVGTLYLKKVEETGKHQLLVRANTNLGTILVNLILATAIPTQRMGKNNVMLVCIPTPEYKPPPTPILIRVKTPEEADELLETLNKYKT